MNPIMTDIIGANVEIIESTDYNLKGIKGIVIDETKNTIIVRGDKNRMIQKSGTVIKINGQIVRMNYIKFRPEEKLKKVRRRGKL